MNAAKDKTLENTVVLTYNGKYTVKLCFAAEEEENCMEKIKTMIMHAFGERMQRGERS